MERPLGFSRSCTSPASPAFALCAALLIAWINPALALDTVRLGKAVPNSFAFGATEVGIEAKIFESEGLEVTVSSFRGDAQMQQALAAGSLDIGLGSGPGLGFRVKGAPAIGVAAMDRGELDGMVLEAANGYELEEAGRTRNLILFGDIVKHFYTHVIFATDDMIEKRPDLLRRFLRGWFKTVAFMRANREFTVKSEQRTIDVKRSVIEKIYDAQIAGFSADGAWDPEAIDVIRASLKELGTLPTVPDAKAIYNDKFVPVKLQ